MFEPESARYNPAPQHNPSPAYLVEGGATNGFRQFNSALPHQQLDGSIIENLKAIANTPIATAPESDLCIMSEDRSVSLIRGVDIPRYLYQTRGHYPS